jgi:hypothetical protein
MRAQAEGIAADYLSVAARASDSSGGDLTEVPVAMLPANTRETTALPSESREAFLERLAGVIAEVYAAPIADTDTPEAEISNLADVPAMLGRSCATCRGECCTAGGNHAFLRVDSIARVRAQQPQLGAESLLERYASQLPDRHYRGSCVYHTPDGCHLPRDWRANICNRYVCGGLSQLQSALNRTGSVSAIVAAADSVHLRRMARIDAQSTTYISLGTTTNEP